MLFQIYGENAGFQLLGWALVFVGLIAANDWPAAPKRAVSSSSWRFPPH